MLDPRNVIHLTGGLTADPELAGPKQNVVKIRLGVDFSGQDKENPENKSGYFNVTYFASDDQQSQFVLGQIADGKLKKGSRIALIGRLNHERYTTKDGQKTSSVGIIAETITYSGGGAPKSDGAESGGEGNDASPVAVPDEF